MTPRSAAQPSIRRHIIAGVFVVAVLHLRVCVLGCVSVVVLFLLLLLLMLLVGHSLGRSKLGFGIRRCSAKVVIRLDVLFVVGHDGVLILSIDIDDVCAVHQCKIASELVLLVARRLG